MKLVMFAKHLQELPMEKAADVLVDLGLEGVDLTVRPTGYIEPEDVEEKLPEAVELFASRGLEVAMLTTMICDAREPYAEATFNAAAECGIPAIKLGYYMCRNFGSYWSDFAKASVQLDGIERMALDYGVSANIHIHSGPYLSATPHGTWLLLDGRDPCAVGAYLDPGHMAVEGGYGGWIQGIDMLAGRINLISMKAMGWTRSEVDGRQAWQRKLVPLEEGIIDMALFIKHVRATGFDGTVTFHSEYQGSVSFKDLSVDELIEQTRRDIAYVRGILEEESN